ncbi:MAG: GntR family transcriptional regulator [Spirochaetia bacterium]|nr:GntR family transcriptional regulator [Spirochaetia bacterium]
MAKTQQIDQSNIIFETLKNDLISLNIKPGEIIVENDICNRFSVTRPPVRTAFKRLSDIGLIEIVPYKGISATLLDLDKIYQLIHMRTILESQIICDFIDSKPDCFTIEELDHNLRLQELIIKQNPVNENNFFEKDSAMHETWFKKMHCEQIWFNIQQQQIEYTRFRMLDFVVTLKYPEIVSDHQLLIKTIKERKKDLILPILGCHLNNGLRRMGDLIFTDYKQFFKLSNNTEYWRNYNSRYKKILEEQLK